MNALSFLVTKLELGNYSEGSWSFPIGITKLELGNERVELGNE
jgi:hypothetical protein